MGSGGANASRPGTAFSDYVDKYVPLPTSPPLHFPSALLKRFPQQGLAGIGMGIDAKKKKSPYNSSWRINGSVAMGWGMSP